MKKKFNAKPTVAVLKSYNDWRRGIDERNIVDAKISVKEVGIAIDDAIAMIEDDSHIELTLGIKTLICKMELMYEAQNKTNTMLGKLLEIAEALADSDDSDDDEGDPVTRLYLDGSPMIDYSNGESGEL